MYSITKEFLFRLITTKKQEVIEYMRDKNYLMICGPQANRCNREWLTYQREVGIEKIALEAKNDLKTIDASEALGKIVKIAEGLTLESSEKDIRKAIKGTEKAAKPLFIPNKFVDEANTKHLEMVESGARDGTSTFYGNRKDCMRVMLLLFALETLIARVEIVYNLFGRLVEWDMVSVILDSKLEQAEEYLNSKPYSKLYKDVTKKYDSAWEKHMAEIGGEEKIARVQKPRLARAEIWAVQDKLLQLLKSLRIGKRTTLGKLETLADDANLEMDKLLLPSQVAHDAFKWQHEKLQALTRAALDSLEEKEREGGVKAMFMLYTVNVFINRMEEAYNL